MLLEVNNITKFYPGQNEPVLDGITFAVDKGERVGKDHPFKDNRGP